MATVWKRWKSKSRISSVPTASWKSRESSEIPTFPQLLRFVIASQPNNPSRRTGRGGKVEIQKQDSHFPTAPTACGARKKLLKVSAMRPVRYVYYAPVLTHTRVNASSLAGSPAVPYDVIMNVTSRCPAVEASAGM